MNRYHLVTNFMASGGYAEYTAVDDEAAVIHARQLCPKATDRIVSLRQITLGLVDQVGPELTQP